MCMYLSPFPRGYKHGFCLAGLLTYSGWPGLPTLRLLRGQWLKDRWATLFMELTAAGLFGTFTRFPFHLKPQERRFTEQDFAKVGNFFECAIIRCGFMYASSGGYETVCREDEERILCKCLINNVLQRPHDRVGTTARLGRNDRTIELQRPHDWAAMSA